MGDLPDNSVYDAAFYEAQSAGARRSANLLLGVFLQSFDAQSMVDFGAGTGQFLSVAKARGVRQVLGLEGLWVSGRTEPGVEFDSCDLNRPITLSRIFDVAMSLEVAEHAQNTFLY